MLGHGRYLVYKRIPRSKFLPLSHRKGASRLKATFHPSILSPSVSAVLKNAWSMQRWQVPWFGSAVMFSLPFVVRPDGHCKARTQLYRGLLCLTLRSTCATDSVEDKVLRTFTALHNNITFEVKVWNI